MTSHRLASRCHSSRCAHGLFLTLSWQCSRRGARPGVPAPPAVLPHVCPPPSAHLPPSPCSTLWHCSSRVASGLSADWRVCVHQTATDGLPHILRASIQQIKQIMAFLQDDLPDICAPEALMPCSCAVVHTDIWTLGLILSDVTSAQRQSLPAKRFLPTICNW